MEPSDDFGSDEADDDEAAGDGDDDDDATPEDEPEADAAGDEAAAALPAGDEDAPAAGFLLSSLPEDGVLGVVLPLPWLGAGEFPPPALPLAAAASAATAACSPDWICAAEIGPL